MDIIRAIEQQQIKQDIPDFKVGDNVKVHYRIVEGNRERIQVFQGDVIRRHGASCRETFTVRKISFSVGVERTFPVHSPKIDKIEITRRGDTRLASAVLPRKKVGDHRKSARSRSAKANTSFASIEKALRGLFPGIVSAGSGACAQGRGSSKETLVGVTVAEIKKRLSEADAEEFAVLERALVADERKGVRSALAVAKRRLQAEADEEARLASMYSFERSLCGENPHAVVVGLDEVWAAARLRGPWRSVPSSCLRT